MIRRVLLRLAESIRRHYGVQGPAVHADLSLPGGLAAPLTEVEKAVIRARVARPAKRPTRPMRRDGSGPERLQIRIAARLLAMDETRVEAFVASELDGGAR